MGSSEKTVEGLLQETAYYKGQLDELAGENLRLDYSISGLRHELKQRRQALALLSTLQRSIGKRQALGELYHLTIETINATLGMDCALVLTETDGGSWRVAQSLGFREDAAARLAARAVSLPDDLVTGTGLLVNGAVEETPTIRDLRQALELPHFVCVGIVIDERPIAILVSGRLREARPLYPPLDDGDLDTLQAVAAFIGVSIRNMRIAVLEETDRLKSEFFANISHEFRTPITLTLGPIQGVLSGRHGHVGAGVRAQLEVMRRSQVRLLALVNQILDLAKLEGGGMELRVEHVGDVNGVIVSSCSLFTALAEERGIELRTVLDQRLAGASLYLDRELFEKAVLNLLSNAFKFTDKGTILVATSIVAGSFELIVTDSGIGIPEDQLHAVFDRFRQADDPNHRGRQGTGIGLSLVQEIVKLHGGRVTVSSRPRVGSTFRLVLPLGTAHLMPEALAGSAAAAVRPHPATTVDVLVANVTSVQTVPELAVPPDPRRSTVLYVDDDPDLRAYVRSVLAPHYNVLLAGDGEEALVVVRERRPDLIVSDLMMPRLSGLELCARLRADPAVAALPFVLLTARAQLEDRIGGLESGVDDYLAKPFAEAELLARVKNLLLLRHEQQRLHRELRAAQEIQRAMMPPDAQVFGGVTLEALYHPCEELSGDLYGSFDEGEWLYCFVADVMSHGVASAQVTYLLQSLVRQAIRRGTVEIADVAAEVSREYAALGLSYDVGFVLARFHQRARVLQCVRGNAPQPALVRGGAVVPFAVPAGNPFSSLLTGTSTSRYRTSTTQLDPGDRVYFFTDGCYEFMASTDACATVGAKRERFVRLLVGSPLDGWREPLLAELVAANEGSRFDDDVTVLRLAIG